MRKRKLINECFSLLSWLNIAQKREENFLLDCKRTIFLCVAQKKERDREREKYLLFVKVCLIFYFASFIVHQFILLNAHYYFYSNLCKTKGIHAN